MAGWRDGEPRPKDGCDGRGEAEEGNGADEHLRHAVEQERHRAAARRFFEAAPLYRIAFEDDGTVSLGRKEYRYWPTRPAAEATRWKRISVHGSLEDAERRLRHVTAPHVYYDERGRLAQAPTPDDDAAPLPWTPWRD